MAQCSNNHSHEFQNSHLARLTWVARLGALLPHFPKTFAHWLYRKLTAISWAGDDAASELMILFTIVYTGWSWRLLGDRLVIAGRSTG